MNDKIKHALLGNRQAQDELAAEGTALPCPFCGAEMQIKKGFNGITFLRCQDGRCGACISFGGVKEVMSGTTEAARTIRNFNRRIKPPLEEIERLAQERDAAIEEIPHNCDYCENAQASGACTLLPEGDECSPDYTEGYDRDDCEHWEWRGVRDGGVS